MESGKTSSLRSVRVKPERLKSLNTIIASSPSASRQTSQLPSPPPSSDTSTSTPSSTPSTTPTGGSQSVLERQLNSPLISQQVPPPSSPPGLPVSTVTSNASAVVTLTPPPEKDIKEMKLDSKQTTLLAQGKENIPFFDEKPIFLDKPIVQPRSPEVIDLESESDTSRDKIIIPSFKKRKLEILREGGLEVTPVDLDARPTVIQPNAISAPMTVKSEEKSLSLPPATIPNSIPKLISLTVTPDIGHMLPSTPENHSSHQQIRHQSPTKQPTNHNSNTSPSSNTLSSRVINLGNNSNTTLLQLYANANAAVSSASTSSSAKHRFVAPTVPNGRVAPPRVTQSRSIFAHNEKMVYGNPKDILTTPKYPPSPPVQPPQRTESSPGGVLDLTQKPAFFRPSLEIVRVPVVPRPNPINLETRNAHNRDKTLESPRKGQFSNYAGMIDSRTMASNNLEITLVNPKKLHSSSPQLPSPPTRNNTSMPNQRRQQMNGKYPVRSEPISPYTPRKSTHPVIPNVPNLSQLNNASSFSRSSNHHHIAVDKRKGVETGNEHHRRISEGNKTTMMVNQIQETLQKQNDSSRRHSVPNIPSGFVPAMSQNNAAFLAQLPNNPGKFLPMLDPMYYPALYNGFFPPPMSNAASSPFLSPEFSAYYKELLASSSQPRLGMAGQLPPTVPTSK